VAFSQSGSSSTVSKSNWNLEALIFVKGGKPENPEKNPGARTRTNNKLNPHMTLGPRIEPGPHWWEASALSTAPSQLPKANAVTAVDGLYKNALLK